MISSSLSLGPERGRGEGLHHVFDIKKLARHLSLYEVYSIWIDGRTDTYNRPLVGCILYAGTPLFGWGFRHFFFYIYIPPSCTVRVVERASNHFDIENGEGGTRANEIFITLTHPTPPTRPTLLSPRGPICHQSL